MGEARIVSFINYKGGVGKTTTTYHIGCSLAEHHGHRVLLVDIDPQSNLSLLCMSYDRYNQFRTQQGTIRDLYRRFRQESRLGTRDFIVREPIQLNNGPLRNLDLLPCDLDMLGEDIGGILPTVSAARTGNAFQVLEQVAERVLREWDFLRLALDEVRSEYDDILIDCPPNLYLMTQNALAASDWYVITVVPEHLSSVGVPILIRKIRDIRERIRRVAAILGREVSFARFAGIIAVKMRRAGQHQDVLNRLREDLSSYIGEGSLADPVFATATTELIGYSEAAEQNLPVWRARGNNPAMAAERREYEAITEEYLRRCHSGEL